MMLYMMLLLLLGAFVYCLSDCFRRTIGIYAGLGLMVAAFWGSVGWFFGLGYGLI